MKFDSFEHLTNFLSNRTFNSSRRRIQNDISNEKNNFHPLVTHPASKFQAKNVMNSCYRLLLYNRTNVSKRLPNRGMEKEDVERRKRNEEEGRSPSPSGISGIQLLSCQSYVNPRCFFAALLIIDHLITIHYTLSPPFFFLHFGTR